MKRSENFDKARPLNGVNTGGYVHPLYSQGFNPEFMKGGDAYEK